MMSSMRFLLAVAVVLCGCAADCVLESGAYRSSFVEVSGTCGAVMGRDLVLAGDLGPPFSGAGSDCTGLIDVADDRCSVNFDRTCELYADDGSSDGSLRFVGTSSIVSPTRAESTMSMQDTGPGGGTNCVSTYEITWTMF
jgi:hypothetical protein